MVSKDQSIGGIIFLLCAVIAVLYIVTLFYPQWLSVFGSSIDISWMSQAQFWIIAVPVFIAFVAIMGIGAWIGWTMATTPPPKPIEEITTEMEKKTTVVEEEAKPAEEPKGEKKPERKKKTEA
jgi:predicted DNA-binding transcriptional regulator